MLKSKNDANQKTRDLGKGHLATKKALEDIDNSYKAIEEIKDLREIGLDRLEVLERKRDVYLNTWKHSEDISGSELPLLHLQLQLKSEVQNQDILEMKRREERQ